MKKIISIITIIASCAALTACGSERSNSVSVTASITQKKDMFSGLKLTRAGLADRIEFTTLEELENFSSIAVVGEFIGETEQEIKYEYEPNLNKDVIADAISTNTIKVTRVLMGDVEVGDELAIDQHYAVADGELITFGGLTPMQNGDEWVFFLRKRSESEHYICSADTDSRFPTKNSASNNSTAPLAESTELGVYSKADFNGDIYSEIVAKYDV